ncbi:type II secretion system protein GspL [Thauera sp. Sel9]|uniref:type II secretion system protein GspL n=1 Tax=Thauera sp. Sel9 TaxID=2974299 RepID=UPI0021E1193B|nr:type II secretion system protein GspL [Thauera sp. Sel9]MCV2217863.1 type II secretion system protein GspL [Thauera sp. Sel9]
MKSRLTLLIPEHWPRIPECEWRLSTRDGGSQHGRSAPRHWPPADEHVAILDGAQTRLLSITVPPGKRKDRPALIAYALEARLARDVDHEHVTVIAESSGSGTANSENTDDATNDSSNPAARRLELLVVDAARLRRICAQFDALERPLLRAVSIFDCLAASAECWQLASGDGCSMALRTGGGDAIAIDLPPPGLDSADEDGEPGSSEDEKNGGSGDGRTAAIADLLALALADPGSRMPQRIELAFVPPLPPACCDTLARRTGVGMQSIDFAAVWARSARAHTLLHGGFAPKAGPGAGLWARLRWPALTAAGALALAGIATIASLFADRTELARLEQRQARVFAGALPGMPAVAPARQLQRALRDARRMQGELAEDDMLSMLGAVVDASGTLPTAFSYRDRGLSVDLPATPSTASPSNPALGTRLVRRGFTVAAEGDGRRLRLSPTP